MYLWSLMNSLLSLITSVELQKYYNTFSTNIGECLPISEFYYKVQLNFFLIPGAVFALPSAEDHDSGIYTIQKYHLVSTSDKFELKVTNSSIGSIDLQLILTKTVDRENEEMFQMEVVAVDGGTPPRSGVIQIHVRVCIVLIC